MMIMMHDAKQNKTHIIACKHEHNINSGGLGLGLLHTGSENLGWCAVKEMNGVWNRRRKTMGVFIGEIHNRLGKIDGSQRLDSPHSTHMIEIVEILGTWQPFLAIFSEQERESKSLDDFRQSR
jgi:hypothetical protein